MPACPLTLGGGQIGGLCVDHGPESGGHARRPALSQEGGDYTRQEVTHAATGHAGVALVAQAKCACRRR